MKGKNHMIISIDAEMLFDKIQHPYVINAMKNGMHLNMINAISDKPTATSY
jgi:hypothetical protein